MDDSGLLNCFLHHSGQHSQGNQRSAMFLCFVSFFNDVWAASATGKSQNTVRIPGTPSWKSNIRLHFEMCQKPSSSGMTCQTAAQTDTVHIIPFCMELYLAIVRVIKELTRKNSELIINCTPR